MRFDRDLAGSAGRSLLRPGRMAAVAAAVYLLLAVYLIPTLGLQNDETLFANGIYTPVTVADSLATPAGSAPLMLVSYTGSLKTWLYAFVFWLFEPSTWSIRAPVALLGAATVALFVRQTMRLAGTAAGVTAAVLLATDPTFLLTVCFDWGPVALQAFLAVSSVCCFAAYIRTGRRRWALAAGLLAGLALWNKALFLWNVAGLAAATAAVYWREVRARVTVVGAAALALGFAAGAWPLLVYNWRTAGATITRNAGFELTWPYVFYKLRLVVETLDGSALFGYMLNVGSGGAAPATLLAVAFLALTLAVVAAPRLRREPMLAWAVIAFWAGYAPMFVGRDVGVGSHHVALLWPLPHLALAVAAGRWAGRSGQRRAGLAVALGIAALLNVRFLRQFRATAAERGPAVIWTDAIDPLHERLAKLRPAGAVFLDWGMFAPLRVLGQGRLPLVWGAEPFSSDQPDARALEAAEALFANQGNVFVDHVAGKHVFTGVRGRFDALVAQSGRARVAVETIRDGTGRPVFELFRVAPRLAGKVEVDGAVDVLFRQPGRRAFVVGDVLDD